MSVHSITCPEQPLHTRLRSGGSGPQPGPSSSSDLLQAGRKPTASKHQPPRLLKRLKAKCHLGHTPSSPSPLRNLGLHCHLVVTLGRAPLRQIGSSPSTGLGRSPVGGGNRPLGSLWREWRCVWSLWGSNTIGPGILEQQCLTDPPCTSPSVASKAVLSRQAVCVWCVGLA